MRIVNGLGDRLLGRLLPRVTAAAETCYYQYRCYNGYSQRRLCCSTTGCGYWIALATPC